MFQMLSFPWTRGGAGTRRTLVCTWLAAGVTGRRPAGAQGSGRARPHFKSLNHDKASAT